MVSRLSVIKMTYMLFFVFYFSSALRRLLLISFVWLLFSIHDFKIQLNPALLAIRISLIHSSTTGLSIVPTEFEKLYNATVHYYNIRAQLVCIPPSFLLSSFVWVLCLKKKKKKSLVSTRLAPPFSCPVQTLCRHSHSPVTSFSLSFSLFLLYNSLPSPFIPFHLNTRSSTPSFSHPLTHTFIFIFLFLHSSRHPHRHIPHSSILSS